MARWLQFQNKVDPLVPLTFTTAVPVGTSVAVQSQIKFQYQGRSSDYTDAFLTDVRIFESAWHQPWSPPVKTRIAPLLAIALSASGLFAPIFVPPEVTTVDRWNSALAEPVRLKPGLAAKQQQTLAFVATTGENITPDKWLFPWSEPVRFRTLRVSQQQSLAYDAIPITNGFESLWHQSWSEPVRIKPSFRKGTEEFQAFYSQPVVTFSYFNRLNEPIWPKKGLKPQFQQSTTADTTVIPTSKIPNWLYAWSEPVRQKPGLLVALQQAAPFAPTDPILARLIQWFSPLDEPVREKIGLWTRLRQFFTTSPAPQANIVNITLSATETGKDVASFGAVVYNRAVTATVSIKEIQAINAAAASIEET